MDKTFDAQAAEARISAAWEEAKAFAAGANAKPGAPTFSIMIPPPNVTGSLHMGHAFNNTLQDILVRWHRMRGHDTLWQPGTDHAGIATQMVTEREMAANQEPSRTEMGRNAFVERVWEQKHRSRGTIIGQLKRLGASCDWDREAFTMDPNFHDAVIRTFVQFYDDGIIYRGKRLVNWDPHFQTAISDLEVENVETQGAMWHFKYPLAGGETYTYTERDEEGAIVFEEERDYISIATTRPETMLGDGAVAVHPSDERYAPIVGKLCEIPVGPKEHRRLIPIIVDEYPDPEFGSGAVKITGAHDFNDYEVARRGGIPMYRLMHWDGTLRADGPAYADAAARAQEIAEGAAFSEGEVEGLNLVPDDLRGLDRFEARKRVVQQITDEGLAVMVPATDPRLGGGGKPVAPEEGGEERALVPLVERKPIMQPYGDRSKVVIEPMLTDQWFVDAERIVGPALEAVREGVTQILPERDRKVYFHWLENIEPWCISRQLWWGHRVPVWYGPILKDGRVHFDARDPSATQAFCAASEAEALEKMQAFYGMPVEIYEDFDAYVLGGLPQDGQPPKAVPAFQDPDVLDTWFSSGLWPLGTLGWPEKTPEVERYFPTSVLITGFDIIFFWVARMMMMQTAVLPAEMPLKDRVPFHAVYVHALVRDEKGKKMSKSLGNVLDPLDLIDEYGADAVRFTLASMAAMGRDLKLSTARIAGYRNFGTKLWNAFRFAEMNGVLAAPVGEVHDFSTKNRALAPANRWILGELGQVREEVDAALDGFRFNDAAGALYGFVWGRVCDWYLELAKPLFDTDAAEETRAVMGVVLDECLKLLHPFMPFVTEELWAQRPRAEMLVHADWPVYGAEDLLNAEADAEMRWVVDLVGGIRSVRGEMGVPAALHVPLLRLDLDAGARAAWDRNAALIRRLARVGDVSDAEEAPKGAATIAVRGGSFALPLAGLIDVAAESARLDKALQRLDKDLKGLEGRLRNPRFLDSAPDDVVAETQALTAEKGEERARLAAARARLEELEG
ncbi:valine--tRNA ligase [Rhodobacteraceae bacterium CCMM004]|nr:valine--tRNA ligase [Rhodobacteraceae bacterium CCMM004]